MANGHANNMSSPAAFNGHQPMAGNDAERPQYIVMHPPPPPYGWGYNGYSWYGLTNTQRNISICMSVVMTIVFVAFIIFILVQWNKTSHEFFNSPFG